MSVNLSLAAVAGEIRELLSDEEVDNAVKAVKREVRAAGFLDTTENCWRFFKDRVHQNLKVLKLILSVLKINLITLTILTSSVYRLLVCLYCLSTCVGGVVHVSCRKHPACTFAPFPSSPQLHYSGLVP